MSRGIVPLIILAAVMVAMGPRKVAAHDVPTDVRHMRRVAGG